MFASTSAAHAHHGGIWNSFKVAHRIKDYRELRPLFTDGAWVGKGGSLAGKDLNKMTREAASVEFNPGNQQLSKERHIMGLRFIDRHEETYWVYTNPAISEDQRGLVFQPIWLRPEDSLHCKQSEFVYAARILFL